MEFKEGDKVRVLGKTREAPLTDTPYAMGDIDTVAHVRDWPDSHVTLERDGGWNFNPEDLELVDEAPMPKYKLLKPISFAAILEAQPDKTCKEFLQEFGRFLCEVCAKYPGNGWFYEWTWAGDRFQRICLSNPVYRDYLIRHGFIEKKEEVFYKLTDKFHLGCNRFSNPGEVWVLARMASYEQVGLVCISYTRYHRGTIEPGDVDRITEEEFGNLCRSVKFVKIP